MMCACLAAAVRAIIMYCMSICSLVEVSLVAGAVPPDVLGPGREEHQGGG